MPEIAALFDAFSFIPAWRMDDIMVSYAVPGGGVGPHFDHYDVFLIQVAGEREWRIGQSCTEDDRRDDTDLSILANFDEQERWVLKPGDMLYVPPGIAHWGEALSRDCITYSIGFRAPSQAETLVDFAQFLANNSSILTATRTQIWTPATTATALPPPMWTAFKPCCKAWLRTGMPWPGGSAAT